MSRPVEIATQTHRSAIDEEGADCTGQVETTPGQVRAWTKDHPVNIRISIPLLFARYYFVIVAGKERRGPERRASERLKHPLLTYGNVIFISALSTLFGFAVLALLHFAGLHLLEESGLLLRRP